MKTINTRSFLIGLLFGICTLLALGAASGKQEDIGRYQIACPDNQRTCFVLDTTTGQVWQRYSQGRGANYGSPDKWDKKVYSPTPPNK